MPGETVGEQVQRVFRESRDLVLRGEVEAARAGMEALSRAFPSDAAIAHLRRAAALVNLEWPAQRSPLEIAAARPPDPAMIDVVLFHVDLPRPPSEIHRGIDYGPLLALSFEAARLRAPRARRILLTDEHTPVDASMDVDRVMRFPIDHGRLMYERMRVQLAYLEGREAGRASTLLDSDVIVNVEPSSIFAEGFDVGLTWRMGLPDAPFNGGVILVGPDEERGVAFLRKARECYDDIADNRAIASMFPTDLRNWWGDQVALAATVGYRSFRERTSEGLVVDGIRVRFHPCEDFNFTAEPGIGYERNALAAKRFLHFKGNRKALQHRYVAAMRAGSV
jgi:hypothetical protein